MTAATDFETPVFPPEVQIALAYARAEHRPAYEALFWLDQRLAGIVSSSSEVLIGQMRLAWWRDVLAAAPDARPSGEPLVEAIGSAWGLHSRDLVGLVDAWEALLTAERLDAHSIEGFLAARSRGWEALAAGPLRLENPGPASVLARRWVAADLLAHLSDQGERELVMATARVQPAPLLSADRSLRPLAILAGLANRSLDRGGAPLMQGRGAALIALRIGIFAR